MSRGVVVIDANLLVLLVVGAASPDFIASHDRLRGYSIDDLEILELLIGQYSEIVLLPHILTEVSNLVRQIKNPMRNKIQRKLATLIETTNELPVPSRLAAARNEFLELGLTDATVLHLCSMDIDGIRPTLITVDSDLADAVHSEGYSVVDYKREYQTG